MDYSREFKLLSVIFPLPGNEGKEKSDKALPKTVKKYNANRTVSCSTGRLLSHFHFYAFEEENVQDFKDELYEDLLERKVCSL